MESPTKISAVAPTGTGTVDVIATDPGGSSAAIAGDRFSYGPVYEPLSKSPAATSNCRPRWGWPNGEHLGWPTRATNASKSSTPPANTWVVSAQTLEQPFEADSCTAQMCDPLAVAVDPQGHIWVVEWQEQRAREFSEAGEVLATIGGQFGAGPGEFEFPWGIAIDGNGDVYVTDAGNGRIQEFSSTGTYKRTLGSPGTGEGQLSWPEGLAVDPGGNVWVADTGSHCVQQCLASTGECHVRMGSQGAGLGQFGADDDVAVAPNGDVLVSDAEHQRVEIFNEAGRYVGQFGTSGQGLGQMLWPEGLALTASGTVLVADSGARRVESWQVAP